MARHRSPRGRLDPVLAAAPVAISAPSRHQGAHRVPAAGRTRSGHTIVASVTAAAAAVGAVGTGAWALTNPSSGTPGADAAETLVSTKVTSDAKALPAAYAVKSDPNESDFLAVALPDEGIHDLAFLAKAHELAVKLAEEQAKPKPGEPYVAGNNANLDGWIAQALGLLGLPQSLAPSVKKIIMKESGGNPRAINLTDSNARAGHPSQGLMQTIPQTYRAYVLPSLSHRPITDPVANITAGIRYMIANYGLDTLSAGGRYVGGVYVGY